MYMRGDKSFSLEHIRQEYPVYGTTDYRHPAIEILQKNGSRISDFKYNGYEIVPGKPKLQGLPAIYAESEEEAMTLRIFLKDSLTGVVVELLYTIFSEYGAIARSVRIKNTGEMPVHLLTAMSLNLDLPDKDYIWMQLSGAWARERHVKVRALEQGLQRLIVCVGILRMNKIRLWFLKEKIQMKYDVVIPVAGKDIGFISKVVKYIRQCIYDADVVYIITSVRYIDKLVNLLKRYERCIVLDENTLIPGLTFDKLTKLLRLH